MKALAVLAFILFTQQPTKLPEGKGASESTRSQISEQSNRSEGNPSNSENSLTEIKTTTGNENTSQTDENVNIQRKLVLFTGLLVVAGFVTAGVILWQSWETRKAAKIANRSLEAVMDKERARLEILAGNIALDAAKPIAIGVRLKNSGPTMVSSIEGGTARLLTAGRDVELDYMTSTPLGFTGTLAASSETSMAALVFLQPNPTLTVSQVVDIQGQQSFVHFFGFVRYRDVYNRSFVVRVHLRWFVRTGLLMQGQISQYWDKTEKPDENSDTQEEPPTKTWIEWLDERMDKLSPPN
jgi:hypothetical protein